MAHILIKSHCTIKGILNRICYRLLRNYGSSEQMAKKTNIKKSVFISQSHDVYTNLALEDWLYKNSDFSHNQVLMIWQNDPCVVIGRHQNPWLEANLSGLTEQGVKLARRNSGGGTVYHDSGNLNLTFFTSRDHYDRTYNLELISRVMLKEFGLDSKISSRHDITCRDNLKISGTAAKLGRPNAYHHCTLLVQVNKVQLCQALQKRHILIKTNATKSIPSPVTNLNEENSKINVDGLVDAIGWEYLKTNPLAEKENVTQDLNEQKGFQLINPTEQWFPGLTDIRDHLVSWDWCYGKTPKFSVSRSFVVPAQILSNPGNNKLSQKFEISVHVVHGRVEQVIMNIPPELSASRLTEKIEVITSLKGCKFTEEAINNLKFSIGGVDAMLVADKEQFVTECVRQVITSV